MSVLVKLSTAPLVQALVHVPLAILQKCVPWSQAPPLQSLSLEQPGTVHPDFTQVNAGDALVVVRKGRA